MSALAYGGPSWRINFSRPARASAILPYSPISFHFLRRAGSLCPRFAFCEKSVRGRFTVFFRSNGSVILVVSSFEFRVSRFSGPTTRYWLLSTGYWLLSVLVFGFQISNLKFEI